MCEQQFHCLSEIDAKVTIFRVGSKVRTFCMFYSVFHHITHKSLPPITSRGTDRICFQEIPKTLINSNQAVTTDCIQLLFYSSQKFPQCQLLVWQFCYALACHSLNFESLLFCITEGIHSEKNVFKQALLIRFLNAFP